MTKERPTNKISTKAKVAGGVSIAAFAASGCIPRFVREQEQPSPTEPVAAEASAVPTAKFDFNFMKRSEQGGELEPFDGTITDPEDGSEWRMVEEDHELAGSYPGAFDGWVNMESIPVDEREEGVRWGLWSNGEGRGRVRFVRVEESEKAQFGEGYEVALRYANEIGYQIAIVDPEGNPASKWIDINSEDSAVDTQNGQILALWHVPAGGQKSPDFPWFFSYSEYDSSGNLKRVFSDNFSFDHSPDE